MVYSSFFYIFYWTSIMKIYTPLFQSNIIDGPFYFLNAHYLFIPIFSKPFLHFLSLLFFNHLLYWVVSFFSTQSFKDEFLKYLDFLPFLPNPKLRFFGLVGCQTPPKWHEYLKWGTESHLTSRFIPTKGKTQTVPILVHTLRRFPQRGIKSKWITLHKLLNISLNVHSH